MIKKTIIFVLFLLLSASVLASNSMRQDNGDYIVSVDVHPGWNLVLWFDDSTSIVSNSQIKFNDIKARWLFSPKNQKFYDITSRSIEDGMRDAERDYGETYSTRTRYFGNQGVWIYSERAGQLVFGMGHILSINQILLLQGWNLMTVTEEMRGKTFQSISSNCEVRGNQYAWNAGTQQWRTHPPTTVFTRDMVGHAIAVRVNQDCYLSFSLQPPSLPTGDTNVAPPPSTEQPTYSNVALAVPSVEKNWIETWGKITSFQYTIQNNEAITIKPDYIVMKVEGYDNEALQKKIPLPVESKEVAAGQTFSTTIAVPNGFAYSQSTVGNLENVLITFKLFDANGVQMATYTKEYNLQGNVQNSIQCNILYAIGSIIPVGYFQLVYTGATGFQNQRPFVYFRTAFGNETISVESKETAGAVLKPTPESSYYFESASDAYQDDFSIKLISPCNDPNIACGRVISKGELFTANGIQFQYTGADRPTKTRPLIKFKRIDTYETQGYTVIGPRASFVLNTGGQSYHFTSASNHRVNDYSIQLVAPCDR